MKHKLHSVLHHDDRIQADSQPQHISREKTAELLESPSSTSSCFLSRTLVEVRSPHSMRVTYLPTLSSCAWVRGNRLCLRVHESEENCIFRCPVREHKNDPWAGHWCRSKQNWDWYPTPSGAKETTLRRSAQSALPLLLPPVWHRIETLSAQFDHFTTQSTSDLMKSCQIPLHSDPKIKP